MSAVTEIPRVESRRDRAERRMRKILWLPDQPLRADSGAAQKAFETSLFVAMFRCLVMYVIIPITGPILGLADIGPGLGVVIGLGAIVAITMSIRRLWRANHRVRWWYTALGTVIILTMAFLVVKDFVSLVS